MGLRQIVGCSIVLAAVLFLMIYNAAASKKQLNRPKGAWAKPLLGFM